MLDLYWLLIYILAATDLLAVCKCIHTWRTSYAPCNSALHTCRSSPCSSRAPGSSLRPSSRRARRTRRWPRTWTRPPATPPSTCLLRRRPSSRRQGAPRRQPRRRRGAGRRRQPPHRRRGVERLRRGGGGGAARGFPGRVRRLLVVKHPARTTLRHTLSLECVRILNIYFRTPAMPRTAATTCLHEIFRSIMPSSFNASCTSSAVRRAAALTASTPP